MKHIKLFNTDTQYQEFASDIEQPIPNVSYVTETDEVHYNESDPILFAYEYQADKFVMGVVIGSDIYVDTYETGFIVADGSGKFSTALAYTNDDLINIQNAIKDHYHLAASTIKTKAPLIEYAVGDTIPNWNAYEKIEMEQIKVAIDAGSAQYIFGYVKGSECSISVTSSNHCNVCNNEGEITYPQGGPSLDDNIKNMIRYKLSAYNVENITSMIESYEQDQVIDNWDEYTIIQ